MGQAKRRKAEIDAMMAAKFSSAQIERWEQYKCLPFAVALARRTGWLLHVDWLIDTVEYEDATVRIPLRAYVGTDRDDIFDPTGVFTIAEFNERFARPWAAQIGPRLGVPQVICRTKHYDDEDLSALTAVGLAVTNVEIRYADEAISAKPSYLAKLPKRAKPTLPAHQAAGFTWGQCILYAEALSKVRCLPVAALMADRVDPRYPLANKHLDGYVHSFVLHEDGTGEDSWGRHSIDTIAARYHVLEWHLDMEMQARSVAKISANQPELFSRRTSDAERLIHIYALD